METFAVILVIWFGLGNTQTYDTIKFDTMEQCQIAKEILVKHHEGWYGPDEDDMSCVELKK